MLDLEARLQTYRVMADWLIRCSKRNPAADRFKLPNCFPDHYLRALVEYLYLTKVSDEQLAQVVALWAKRYDAYPELIPPSPFLVIGLSAARGEKRNVLEQFSRMMQQWPDPSDKFWHCFTRWDNISDMVAQVDQNLRNEAHRWLKGQLKTNELSELVRQRIISCQTGDIK